MAKKRAALAALKLVPWFSDQLIVIQLAPVWITMSAMRHAFRLPLSINNLGLR